MKKLFILFAAVMMAASSMGQVYPTKFLGIPIDGTKEDMIKKLQEKGFMYDSQYECLSGEFNGMKVNLYVITTNNKVSRIMVAQKNVQSEGQIKITFNNLFRQFKNHSKYLSADISQDVIPDDEDISYEMIVHNKFYDREFLQMTHTPDSLFMAERLGECGEAVARNVSAEDLQNPDKREFWSHFCILEALRDAFRQNSVWFRIAELDGEYYITIYYDNGYNRANGEDL